MEGGEGGGEKGKGEGTGARGEGINVSIRGCTGPPFCSGRQREHCSHIKKPVDRMW